MTEQEMLEIEKHWCENCCNLDKEHSLPDGYANCKMTNMLTFGQTCGKECKFFNVPADNVVVLPCKVKDGDVLCTARTIFEAWNDVTGAVCKGTSWYYELESVIEDVVKISFGAGVLYKEEAEKTLGTGENNNGKNT